MEMRSFPASMMIFQFGDDISMKKTNKQKTNRPKRMRSGFIFPDGSLEHALVVSRPSSAAAILSVEDGEMASYLNDSFN